MTLRALLRQQLHTARTKKRMTFFLYTCNGLFVLAVGFVSLFVLLMFTDALAYRIIGAFLLLVILSNLWAKLAVDLIKEL